MATIDSLHDDLEFMQKQVEFVNLQQQLLESQRRLMESRSHFNRQIMVMTIIHTLWMSFNVIASILIYKYLLG